MRMVLGEAHLFVPRLRKESSGGNLLGCYQCFLIVRPTTALRVRRFSPLWHLVSEGATHNKESKDERQIQKHTAACSC